MAKPEWGIKRVCQSCGTRYYDFEKTPIVCPSCDTAFDPEAVLKSRRNRVPVVEEPKPKKEDAKDGDDEDEDATLVSDDEDDEAPPDAEGEGDDVAPDTDAADNKLLDKDDDEDTQSDGEKKPS